jgi:cytidylate kinase
LSVVSSADRGIVIAVDGTSGSGKSSTSRGVADRLGLRYLDTGAMYRALTWWMLRHGVDVHDPEAVAARCGEPRIVSGTDPLAPTITVDGEDVAAAIREPDVNAAVSPVSAVPDVRARMVALQRAAIDEARQGPGIVVEGRDIGSVVCPEAPVKVYLSADAGARANRRAAEEGGSDVGATEASLLARDRIDSGRAVSPLVMAEGAVHIDTTAYSLDEVIAQVVALVEQLDSIGSGS